LAKSPVDDDGNRRFDDIWRAMHSSASSPGGFWGASERGPDIEIIEESEALIITCEVLGVEREDIRVDVSPQRVVINATARPGFDALRGIFRRERPFGSFERAIALPAEVCPDAAQAHYNNGVLEVVLPKRVAGGVGVYRLPAE
jgi:HSP20 family protein